MSAEILRRAAALMREQANAVDALAVADWLENSADVIDGQSETGNPTWVVPPGCFAVARAYLGESA